MPVDAMLAPGAEVSGVFGVLEIHSKTVEFIYSAWKTSFPWQPFFKMGHNSTNRNSADRNTQYIIHPEAFHTCSVTSTSIDETGKYLVSISSDLKPTIKKSYELPCVWEILIDEHEKEWIGKLSQQSFERRSHFEFLQTKFIQKRQKDIHPAQTQHNTQQENSTRCKASRNMV